MSRDFKEDGYGPLDAMVYCRGCGWEGLVFYATKPPEYCSTACKQKAYRQRKNKISNIHNVTYLIYEWREKGFSEDICGKLREIAENFGVEAAEAASELATLVGWEAWKDRIHPKNEL